MTPEYFFKIIILGVADSHEIEFAHFTEIVCWYWLLSPERIGLFLNRELLTTSCSSIYPLSTLFLYYSKVWMSRTY